MSFFERLFSKDFPTIEYPDAVITGPAAVLNMPLTTTTKRLRIRSDEAARRKIADTDGARRRIRELAERHRLI